MVAAPPSGSLPRSFGETSYPEGPRNRRGTEGWAYAPLGTGGQVIQLSPCRAGLAGRRPTRLRTPPASTACSGPLWLSPPGKPLTRRSSFRTSSASGRNGPSDETAHPSEAIAAPSEAIAARSEAIARRRTNSAPDPGSDPAEAPGTDPAEAPETNPARGDKRRQPWHLNQPRNRPRMEPGAAPDEPVSEANSRPRTRI